MRFILRLAIAALVANVAWHAWLVSSSYYKFRDTLQSASQGLEARTDDEVKGRVLDLASQFDVPLTEDHFKLRRDFRQLFIDGSYTKNVDVLPSVMFPWTFEFHIDSSYGNPVGLKDVVPASKELLPDDPRKPKRTLPQ